MRRSVILIFVFMVGCGSARESDVATARAFVQSMYSSPGIYTDITLDEDPEYANIPKIPRDHLASWAPDQSAACGVRVRFSYQENNRTTHDDWVVWVNSDHKAVGWSGNPNGDNWRQYVQSLANQ